MPFNHHLNDKVLKYLSNKNLVLLVGPSSVGKTMLMQQVVKLNSDFNIASGFTTRPLRKDEDPSTYRFLPNTPIQKQQIVNQIASGELLQFAVHPQTRYLYGTSFKDYSAKYNLLDVLSNEVYNFQTIGFATCRTIMIIAEPEEWQDRFTTRNFSRDETYKRIKEGIASLNWGLENQDNIHWIHNTTSNFELVAKDIIAIAKGQEYKKDESAINTANRLLIHLNEQAKYE